MANARRPGQRRQQLHHLGMRRDLLRPVGANGRDRRVHDNRRHDEAGDKRRQVGIARNALVGVNVGDDDRFVVEHAPPRDATRHLEPQSLPERRDRILGNVVTQVAVTHHEGDAVGARDVARRAAHDLDDLSQGVGRREALYGGDELRPLRKR